MIATITGDAIRSELRNALHDEPAHRMTDQRELCPTQLVGKSNCIAGGFVKRIAAIQFSRGAVASQIGEDIRESIRCQIGQRRIPTGMVTEPIVQNEYAYGSTAIVRETEISRHFSIL